MEKTRCPLRLVIFKNYFFVWLNSTAESANCSLFLKNLEKIFLQFDLQKKTSSNTSKIHRNIYRKNLSAIIYRYRFKKFRFIDYRYCPGLFLQLSIIVIALVQNGLSCPSLCLPHQNGGRTVERGGPEGTFGTGPGIFEGPKILKMPCVKNFVRSMKGQFLTA